MSLESFSLSDLKKLQGHIPELGNFPSRLTVASYEEFVDVLYKDLDCIVARMEENPELLKKDKEDRLTIDVKNQLCAMGYDAGHDTKIGGHVDLVVKKAAENWKWIGEAKIHKSYDYLFEGFQQLTTRYSTGGYNNSQGGMLIYIRNSNAQNVIETWKSHLKEKEGVENLQISECPVNPLSFYSTHCHQRTHLAFKARHIPFSLHFDPQDHKSSNK